jgi:hypothetical protein
MLPPSDTGWTLTITQTKSPPANNICIVKNSTPCSTPIASRADADIAMINMNIERLDLKGHIDAPRIVSPPVLASQPVCNVDEAYCVPEHFQIKYPPFRIGWGTRAWVVVIRGLEVGIFYDYWCVSIPWRCHRLT